MKKRLALILMSTLIVGMLAGCGETQDPTPATATGTVSETTEPTETPAATEPVEITPQSLYPNLEGVVVDNVADFLAALDDNATIYVTPGKYNFSQYFRENDVPRMEFDTDASQGFYKYYDDGLVIVGYRNLTIASADPEDMAELVIEDPYSHVIDFRNCTNLTVSDLILGHDVEPGYCSGNVVNLDNCNSTNIKNCNLYGCGAYALSAFNSKTITVLDCYIHDCTYGCIDLSNTTDVYVSRTDFVHCKEFAMFYLINSSMEMYKCSFKELKGDMFYLWSSKATVLDCTYDTDAARGTFLSEYYGNGLYVD